MSDITPRAAQDVNPDNLMQFKGEMDFLLSNGWRQRDIGALLGISEGNFSNYLYGVVAISYNIISEFRYTFKKVLKKRKGAAPSNTPIDNTISQSETDQYQPLEKDEEAPIDQAIGRLETVTAEQKEVLRQQKEVQQQQLEILRRLEEHSKANGDG
jgi:hypothetical protein